MGQLDLGVIDEMILNVLLTLRIDIDGIYPIENEVLFDEACGKARYLDRISRARNTRQRIAHEPPVHRQTIPLAQYL